jgi:hypothetical protein
MGNVMGRKASTETKLIQDIIKAIPTDRLAATSPADLREAIQKKKLDFDKCKGTVANELSKARKRANVRHPRGRSSGGATGWDLSRYNALMRELSQFVAKCGGAAQAKEWLGTAYGFVETLGSLAAAKDAIDTLESIKGEQGLESSHPHAGEASIAGDPKPAARSAR